MLAGYGAAPAAVCLMIEGMGRFCRVAAYAGACVCARVLVCGANHQRREEPMPEKLTPVCAPGPKYAIAFVPNTPLGSECGTEIGASFEQMGCKSLIADARSGPRIRAAFRHQNRCRVSDPPNIMLLRKARSPGPLSGPGNGAAFQCILKPRACFLMAAR